MLKRVIITTVVALAVLGGIFGYRINGIRKAAAAMASAERPPTTVASARAQHTSWRNTIEAVGSLESPAGITVRAELEGRVAKIAFTPGAAVEAGALLVELDTGVEEARLEGLKARAKLAEVSRTRALDLWTQRTNSKADVDEAEATYAEATAAVQELQATIAKKRVVAPFAGRLGIAQIDPGQFLNKGDAIVQLEAVDPLYVDFTLPQQEISRLKPGMDVRVSVDAFPGRVFEASIQALNPRINESTRNVQVRAIVPNADESLHPGMFAKVEVLTNETRDVLVLPASAVTYSPFGNSVYRVAEENGKDGKPRLVAQQIFVEVGPARGDQVAILKGIKAGEQIVTAGQMKLRNGAPVQINNTVTPANDPNPQPVES